MLQHFDKSPGARIGPIVQSEGRNAHTTMSARATLHNPSRHSTGWENICSCSVKSSRARSITTNRRVDGGTDGGQKQARLDVSLAAGWQRTRQFLTGSCSHMRPHRPFSAAPSLACRRARADLQQRHDNHTADAHIDIFPSLS